MKRSPTHYLVKNILRLMAFRFNHSADLRAYLKSEDGPINFTLALRTENDSVQAGIRFWDGRVQALRTYPEKADTTLIFAEDGALREMLRISPNEVLTLLMHNRIRTEGNFTYLNLFNFYMSLLLGGHQRKQEKKRQDRENALRLEFAQAGRPEAQSDPENGRQQQRLRGHRVDPFVRYLDDPYLPELSLADFPRLKDFLDHHMTHRPQLCHERPALLTAWYRENGFETDSEGNPWIPELRQANAFFHLMANKQPIIRKNDLIAGTTTARDVGVVLYPDAHGTLIWGELLSAPHRELNPFDVDAQTVRILHHEVFPFWFHRNFREWVRENHGNPLGQQLDERFAVYFVWKSVGISHTVPDFPSLLHLGARGLIERIDQAIRSDGATPEKKATLEAMVLCLEGIVAYAKNLACQAAEEAKAQSDPKRKEELVRLAEICRRVPEHGARSLDEAVNAIWIAWVGLHNENTNTGLSLGRLDQWLQPFFAADLDACSTAKERDRAIRRAVELIGCLFLRCTDHLPLIPDIGNYLFGGSSSDQAITLGGITSDGRDAVCDMTYILLKVTEMLGVRDPNVNARFHGRVNSDVYLRRLCEVNRITCATPSLHNDEAVLASLEPLGYPQGDRRDWSATGCVEPTLSGRHMGHTGSILLNMVGALEMAMFNGRHPLMKGQAGPSTGETFATFEAFFEAFTEQFGFLIDQAVTYNNMLAEAHAFLRPTPLLSSLIEGCIQSGRDAVRGGARYNSSGTALIGLADVTDSLMAIKKLVFEQQLTSLATLREAAGSDFANHPQLRARMRNKVPLFGSGSEEALEMTRRVTQFASDRLGAHRNFRGGPYTAGFWSMSNHVAFGTLAGALPSGRSAGKAFTPGLTPQPVASPNLLDNLRDVAGLDPTHMSNNMAFNVKVVPGANDTHGDIVDRMLAYVKTYFALGGMQMQMNVVTSQTLRRAMVNPDAYRNLLVRISGYNAYFVTLNRDMQMELVERAEYGIS